MGGYNPAHAGRLGRPADGAKVLWILQAVEHQQHGIGPLGQGFARHWLELPVLPRTDIGDHALVSLRVRDVVQLAPVGCLDRDPAAGSQLSKLLQARFVPEALSQQEPLHWTAGSERLENGFAPVDDVRGPGHGLPYPLPAGAVFRVIELDARPEELLPDLVRAGEVAAFASGLAFSNQPLNLRVHCARKLDDVEDKVRVAEHRHRGGALRGRRLSRFQPWVKGFDELEEMPDGRGEIEIVLEGLVPALANFIDLPPPSGGRVRVGGGGGGVGPSRTANSSSRLTALSAALSSSGENASGLR